MNLAPKKERGEGAEQIPIYLIIPNLITLTAMAAGLTSIQYAINGQWERALVAVLIALVLDGLDGAVARRLDATSDFGAQLDNLSDFLSFGIAPSVILYTWILQESGKVGWIAMIFYTAATALRLARYNVEQKKLPQWRAAFFSGVPSPAGAGFALFPLIIWFQDERFFAQFAYASPVVGVWTICVALLMVSRIPTFSIKTIKIPASKVTLVMAGTALLLALIVHVPWLTLTFVGLAYMASLPFSIARFRRMKAGQEAQV